MGAFRHKPKSAYDYENTYYDKKTSDHGHYEPEVTGKRHGRDGSQAAITEMRWVEDNRTFEAPPVNTPPEAAPEPMPEQIEEPKVIQSERVQKAQDLVDKYTADITGGNSIYNTQVFSPTPNLNTQTEGSTDTYESNTYIDPKYSLDTPGKDAAESFLKSKKLELASGLNLQ